jgi:protein HIRA/HIR1
MRIIKFPWLKHTEGPRKYEIYSVSVSPDGLRLATGGLDGKIKIWSIETLYKYKNNKDLLTIDNTECRPLCSMSRHAGAITCVRFCPNNRFLATGSDDKLVLIWEKDEEKTKIMKMHRNGIIDSNLINNNNNNGIDDSDLEHWTVRKRLVAHDNDVQDMAWAPDGSILVTVGLDRSIVVWNGNTFEKIKKFDIHQSHVKGVIFDPAGKYFATCSDDRSMRIFRYRRGVNVDGNDTEFVIEQVIKDPFAKSPLTTYFRRSSWSPDGLYIAAPNGTNEGVNANVIIKRGSWESELSLIGHRLPCEVCSFSPRLYDPQMTNNNSNNKNNNQSNNKSLKTETVIITAGQDKTLALWSSSCATPLCVATEISAKSITDVAWNPNGLNVFLCGLDGNILSLFFDERELGNVLPLEENNRVLIRYGKDRDLFFPESVEQLKLEEIAEKRGVIGNIHKNIIKPDRIKSLMNGNNDSTLHNEHKSSGVMNVLIPRSKKHPNKKMPVPKISNEEIKSSLNIPTNNITSNKVNILSSSAQKVTVTKSGKKRVAPTLISLSTPTNSELTSQFTSTSNKSLILEKKSKLSKIISLPYPALPKHGLSTLVSSLRSNILNDESEAENLDSAIDYIAETHNHTSNKNIQNSSSNNYKSKFSNHNKNQNGSNKRYSSYSVHDSNNGPNKRRKLICPNWIQESIVSPLTIYGDKNSNSNILFKKSDSKNQLIEVRYEYKNNYKYLNNNEDLELNSNWSEFDSFSKLVAKSTTDNNSKSKHDWELFINEKIVFINESELNGLEYWCLGTANGRILIMSSTGRQLCGSIELGSDIVNLICHESHILCICSNSLVYSWKLENSNNGMLSGVSMMTGISLAPIINVNASTAENKKKLEINTLIESFYMLENGCPIIVVKLNQRKWVYTYDLNLECWVEILDNWYIEQLNINDEDSSLKLITSNNMIIKIIIKRLISEKDDNIKSFKFMDKNIVDNIFKSWKSINNSVLQCINSNLENS